MWIQHPEIGALSVVLADNLKTGSPDLSRVMIRARRSEHLQLLRDRCASLADAEVILTEGTNYKWRLIIDKPAFAAALVQLIDEIDYRNVKGRAHAREQEVGSGFVSALHRIWAVLLELQ
ncbi:MAG: hypothetical protein H6831_08790 [Planctomycetes bacterium]|nr:hypothetical protein [Planctomycetota bacterium]